MNPVNATTLYVSASRAVLECDPRKPNTFADVYKLLPFFRQSLACLVCGKMLQDPIAPTNSECQHYVCLGCKGQKMQMKPSCSWCKDYAFFEENKQLSLLVECYRSLCLYIIHSPLLQPISSQVGGSPEVMALLDEVLISSQAETEPEELLLSDEVNSSAPESLTPTEAPPVPAELSSDPQSSFSNPPCSNGSQEYNIAELEDLPPSSPELEVCEVVEEQSQGDLSVSSASCGGLELNLPSTALDPTDSAVCSFRDGDSSGTELEEGEVLLLSVEEVLQTLDPIQPDRGSPHAQTHAQMCAQLDAAHNYTQADRSRMGQGAHAAPVAPEAPTALRPPPARASRKRSHSESDRERVQPLPISCILQGSPSRTDGMAVVHTVHAAPAPPPVAPHAYPPSLSNGVAPKAGRPITHSHAKGSRKHMEQMAKKPHSKGRSGAASKCKERSKDQRLLAGSLVPPSPAKPPYRKPVEKKGCKCGRATQNPSVLTCRGQRCPCYSNRKACLDCICRGCQNSYMANGEKKLEAFAVPEKALEQTRLTLGINLTSITAAAALRNPPTTSIRSNTLLNVSTATGSPVATAYLTASPPQEPTFEDSLELLIG